MPQLTAFINTLTIVISLSLTIQQVNSNDWSYIPPAYVCSPKASCSTSTHSCLANPNHPQSTTDDECRSCQSDQTYWPCDVDGLCYCWDKSTKQIPPAPSTRYYNNGQGLNISSTLPCDIITSEVFNKLAPEAQAPYSYEGFCQAVNEYNINHPTEGIFNMGSVMQQKAELASFFGNALHESDEFKAGREYLMCADHKIVANEVYCRPCDVSSFDWDNMTCPDGASLASQGRPFNGYCQSNLLPPEGCSCDDVYERMEKGPMAGYVKANEVYFGRGAIQLSWNYNYIRASIALTGAPQTLCQRPDLVAKNEQYSWGAGLFYWMENVKNDKTCHQSVLIDEDFGLTLDNINGGLECPADDHGWHGKAVQLRLNRYCRAATAIGVEKLLSLEGCIDMSRRMKQCLKEGTCKACKVWEDSLNLDDGGMLASDIDDKDVQSYLDSTVEGSSMPRTCSDYVKEKKCVRDTSCVWQNNKEVCSDKAAKQEQKPQQQQQQSSGLTQEEKDKIKQEKLEAKQLAKEQAKAEAIEAAAAEAKQETPPPRTSKPTSSPTSSPSSTPTKRVVVNPTSSAASSFGIVPLSPTKPDIKPVIPSDEEKLSSHASSFAIPHSKGQSIVPHLDTSSAFETTESLLENPGDMTNWAMTPLDHPPEPAVNAMTSGVTTTTSSQPTRRPVTVINIAEQAFRPSSSETQELDISDALLPKQDTSASIVIFTPLDDVTLSRSLPTLNFGSSQVIAVDMLEGEVALLRFDLSAIGDNTIHKAILRLTARDNNDEGADHSGSYYIQTMANDWIEDTVTYETAPKTTGVLFESIARQKNGNQYELDVTDAVANHIVSFRILGTNRVRTEFISKDSTMTDDAPVLLVELESSTEQAAVVNEATSEISSGSGVISGHIWHDKNADGIRGASEPGLRGILVDLYKCDHDKWVEGTRTTSTGDYIFNELADGSYYVDVTISSDYGFTFENAGSDKTKSSYVDASTGRSECIELTTKSEFAIVNAGIASKSAIKHANSEVSPTTSEQDDNEDSVDYNCRGKPCAEEGFCRSQHNFCGQGEEYCNEESRWTPDCGTRAPSDRPTAAPTVSYDLEEHCEGDPCQEEGECRSFVGYCGQGTLYCNSDSIWVPECHKPLTSIKAPTRSPLAEGMTSSPTEADPPTLMPTPPKDSSNLSPFILPTLTEIDTPKQSDIITMSNTYDKNGVDEASADVSESSDDESSRDQEEDISTTFNDVESSPWYIRYSDPRNGGCTCCLERGVLILLFTTMFISQLLL